MKTKPEPKPAIQKGLVRDPLAAIPMRPDCVELRHDLRGHIHLRLNAEPKGLAGRVARWIGYDYTRKVELDEFGTLYYSHVDGRTPLETIVGCMADSLGGSRKEVEERVVLFTRKLMLMNILALKIPSGSTSSEIA